MHTSAMNCIAIHWQRAVRQNARFPLPFNLARTYAKMSFDAGHTYHDAITQLNTLQSSHLVMEERKRTGWKPNEADILEMKDYIRRLGYKLSDFNRLNVVHVAGTKGKGTTCAYVNSILGAYQKSHHMPKKVGLFTSPHLLQVRERIQINSTPISEHIFAKYFFEVWNRLEESAELEGLDPAHKPVYFRYLTLLSLHIYMSEGVDCAIYEVGVGGTFDATNIFTAPAATGITALGIDHVGQLGHTIEEISRHKAGIFKSGSPAYSVPQPSPAQTVIEDVAKEENVKLKTVGILPALKQVKIVPDANFQRGNASLAVALASAALEKLGELPVDTSAELPEFVVRGIEEVKVRGRCEIKEDGQDTWYLDGAHTADSLAIAATWFSTQVKPSTPVRVLIYNQQSREEAVEHLTHFQKNLRSAGCPPFTHVVFCTNLTWKSKGYTTESLDLNNDPAVVAAMSAQQRFAEVWKEGAADEQTETYCIPTLEEVVELVRSWSGEKGGAQILCTGSFRHIGGVLTILEGESSS